MYRQIERQTEEREMEGFFKLNKKIMYNLATLLKKKRK